MVFGIDDILEGVAIGDILYFIGEALFGAEAITAGTTAVSGFFEQLLGEEGIQAIQDLVLMAKGQSLPGNVEAIGELGELELKKIDDIFIWEELPEVQKVVPKNVFNQRVAIIANQLKRNGINILNKDGFNFLKSIVRKTIQLGSEGVKQSLNPKILVPALLGGIGANKLFLSMKNKAEQFNKKKSNLDILRELRKKESRQVLSDSLRLEEESKLDDFQEEIIGS